jgi:hypothetical protein
MEFKPWLSKKQELVTLSTTEAECVAETHTAKEECPKYLAIYHLHQIRLGNLLTARKVASSNLRCVHISHEELECLS